MGRNKPLTGRKRTLQLSNARKSEGSQLIGKGIYAQPVSTASEELMSSDGPVSPGQSSEDQPTTENVDSKLADFMQAIHTLGSREDIESLSVSDKMAAMSTADGVQGVAGESQTTSTVATVPSTEAPPTFWHQVMDANSNHTYYWNPLTNEVSWVLPDGGVISYGGVSGGDEQDEPLDYFAYYDQGLVVPERQGKGRGKVMGAEGGGGEGGDGKAGGGQEGGSNEKAVTVCGDAKKTGGQASASDLQDSAGAEPSAASGKQHAVAPVGEVSTVTELGREMPNEEGVTKIGPSFPPGLQGSEVNPDPQSTNGSATKRRLSREDGEEGESQLMPTSKGSTAHSSSSTIESVSPPRKMARSVKGHHGRGITDERAARKTRNVSTPTSAKQEQQALRFQASSLADELSRKLQFLHVSLEGLSDIQMMQVQVKTRIADWEEGGLETQYLLTKLKQASEELLSYEHEAAPKGWKFLWDSTTCRYQFQHLSTGEISWEYPTSTTEDDASESSGQEEGEEGMVQSPPVTVVPPPPPPPVAQQPPPPPPLKPVKQVVQTGSTPVLPTGSSTSSKTVPLTAKHTSSSTPVTMTSPMTSSAVTSATKKQPIKSAALPPQVTRSLIRENIPEPPQRSKSNSTKDLATPTAAFLGGGEMVAAPLPRAWKYENDELNRRVRREGSIERREEVNEKEISPSDVRRKLAKRLFPGSRRSTEERVDLSDLPPPPPPPPPSSTHVQAGKRSDGDTPTRPPPSVAGGSSNETSGDLVKEAIQALSAQTRDDEKETNQQKDGDHGNRDVTAAAVSPTPPHLPPPPPSQGPPDPAVGGGEESEVRLRERLIERTRRLRAAVSDAQNTLSTTTTPPDAKTVQSQGVEESTGLVYTEQEKDAAVKGEVEPQHEPATNKPRDLIRSGYTQIQVSYDRIEPETGESENVAVSDDVDRAASDTRRGDDEGERQGAEFGEMGEWEEGEVVSNEEGVLGEGTNSAVQTSDSQHEKTAIDGSKWEGGHLPAVEDTVASAQPPASCEQEEQAIEEREGQTKAVEGGEVGDVKGEGETGTPSVAEAKTRGGEEGELSSDSSTPGPTPQSQTTITPRCYMDQEEGAESRKRARERGGYDSEGHIGYSDREDTRYNTSRRRYSPSRSRSRSRDPADSRSGRRGSKHRRDSDQSDYSDGQRQRYSSSKHRRRGDDYSSGSEYSDDNRYSRRRRGDYDSDLEYRSRERLRRSRGDEERSSSRRHKRRSSRSHSKESRGSGKHRRHKEKSISSAKKKKKDKRDRRHKKDRKDEPRVPKKVTVGRVGKVSSLRTLTSDGGEGSGGGGDTPLDKAQATIADTIDEKRKQERQVLEKREENRRLENKIQQHMQQHGTRSQTTQVVGYPTSVYPQLSPTDLTQGGYYSTAYPGYQYPQYAGQGWATGGQWSTSGVTQDAASGGVSGTQYQQGTQYVQQSGVTGEQQHGNMTTAVGTGTGHKQYDVATAVATTETGQMTQQYGEMGTSEIRDKKNETISVPGTGEQRHGVTGVSETGEETREELETGEQKNEDLDVSATGEQKNEDMSVSGTGEQKNEDLDVSATGEQKNEDMSVSGTGEQTNEGSNVLEPGTHDSTFETGEAQYGEKTQQLVQEPVTSSKKPLPPVTSLEKPVHVMSLEKPLPLTVGAIPASCQPASAVSVDSQPASAVSVDSQPASAVSVDSQSVPAGQPASAVSVDSQPASAVSVDSQSAPAGQPASAVSVDSQPASAVSLPTSAVSCDGQPASVVLVGAQPISPVSLEAEEEITECEMDIDSGGNSPVLMPSPGPTTTGNIGGVTRDQGKSLAVDPASKMMSCDEREPSRPEENSPEPLPPGEERTDQKASSSPQDEGSCDEGTDGGTVENGMETEEPAPPGMESDQPAITSQPPVLRPLEPTPPNSEIAEVKPTPSAVDVPQAQPPLPPEPPQEPPSSPVKAMPSDTPTPAPPQEESTPTPQPSTRGVTTPQATAAPDYATPPPTTSQGYDMASAAAAYAHATKTGQPYQYHPQQYTAQQGYDYATYAAYVQQMSQSYAGGYVLGADGQYYPQASPYGAYAAAMYGGYYTPVASYSYGTTSAYPASPQQVATTQATSTSDADKKGKKGEFSLPDSKEKQVKDLMSKWSSFKES